MTDKDEKPANNDPETERKDKDSFRIRSFRDLRCFRDKFMRAKEGEKYIGFDSAENPRPDEGEEDFGLKRSTADEALKFLRENLACQDEDDDMTEFLHDE